MACNELGLGVAVAVSVGLYQSKHVVGVNVFVVGKSKRFPCRVHLGTFSVGDRVSQGDQALLLRCGDVLWAYFVEACGMRWLEAKAPPPLFVAVVVSM